VTKKARTVRVYVPAGDELAEWVVPFGFGAAYKRCASSKGDPRKLAETIRDILSLVGYAADVDAILAWPLLKRVEAEVYCASVHMRASDNPVPVPPRPEWMGEPWKGPQSAAALACPFWENPHEPTVLT
jgi:hypothetical protein